MLAALLPRRVPRVCVRLSSGLLRASRAGGLPCCMAANQRFCLPARPDVHLPFHRRPAASKCLEHALWHSPFGNAPAVVPHIPPIKRPLPFCHRRRQVFGASNKNRGGHECSKEPQAGAWAACYESGCSAGIAAVVTDTGQHGCRQAAQAALVQNAVALAQGLREAAEMPMPGWTACSASCFASIPGAAPHAHRRSARTCYSWTASSAQRARCRSCPSPPCTRWEACARVRAGNTCQVA